MKPISHAVLLFLTFLVMFFVATAVFDSLDKALGFYRLEQMEEMNG